MITIVTNKALTTIVTYLLLLLSCTGLFAGENSKTYPIVDTGQVKWYDNNREISRPKSGKSFSGQDADYTGNHSSYKDNGDGTVTDIVTGLMWQKDPGSKMTYDQAVKKVESFRLAGYNDWRLPSIKELYSLILFSGVDLDPKSRPDTSILHPFIDNVTFKFSYGDPAKGERLIDSQFVSSTVYTATTMGGNETVFGVNFADGRIKGYPIISFHTKKAKTFYVLYVRGNTQYGINKFIDNGNGTISDSATGLMWMQGDSGASKTESKGDGSMSWKEAIAWSEKLEYAGHSDWRLPNAKELQSIVDYKRSPKATGSAAIDPLFSCTKITDEGGKENYPFYWTGTTHVSKRGGRSAIYVTFGEALGWMGPPGRPKRLEDVHGAGAQRSDPKTGNATDFPYGRGPQGDVIRIKHFVRCVRDIK